VAVPSCNPNYSGGGDRRITVQDKPDQKLAGHHWLTPGILATQEAEIRRMVVQSQPGQIVHKTLSQKTLHKKRAGGVAQGSNPITAKKKKKKRKEKEKRKVNKILF
jgi:hypothetical protein